MAAPFKISINNPCYEKWSEMQSDSIGGFCRSCQKSVTDFTQFSDRDLRDWFAKNQGLSCGRFKPEQLDRVIIGKSIFSIKRFKPSLIAASLFAFLSFPKLSKADVLKQEFTQTDKSNNLRTENVGNEVLSDSLKTIRGKVVDKDDRSPLPGVSIRIKDSMITASTNQYGEFEFKLPANFTDKNCILTISYIGYKPLNSFVDLSNGKTLNLELCASAEILGGPEIVFVRNPSIWDRLRQLFGKKAKG